MTGGWSVSIIGAGGVAWSLAQSLAEIMCVDCVFSRSIENARRLADLTGSMAVDSPEEIRTDSSLYIVALADNVAADIIRRIPKVPEAVWVITSGTLSPMILAGKSPFYGVFYPLQTFSRGQRVSLADVPFFIEGSTPRVAERLMTLARCFSDSVYYADSSLRCKLHVAGVISCNFVNHLWHTADCILRQEGLSLDVVRPLISQSLGKLSSFSPYEAQTGPARRGDMKVMKTHMAELGPEDAKLYRLLSNRILHTYFSDESYSL